MDVESPAVLLARLTLTLEKLDDVYGGVAKSSLKASLAKLEANAYNSADKARNAIEKQGNRSAEFERIGLLVKNAGPEERIAAVEILRNAGLFCKPHFITGSPDLDAAAVSINSVLEMLLADPNLSTVLRLQVGLTEIPIGVNAAFGTRCKESLYQVLIKAVDAVDITPTQLASAFPALLRLPVEARLTGFGDTLEEGDLEPALKALEGGEFTLANAIANCNQYLLTSRVHSPEVQKRLVGAISAGRFLKGDNQYLDVLQAFSETDFCQTADPTMWDIGFAASSVLYSQEPFAFASAFALDALETVQMTPRQRFVETSKLITSLETFLPTFDNVKNLLPPRVRPPLHGMLDDALHAFLAEPTFHPTARTRSVDENVDAPLRGRQLGLDGPAPAELVALLDASQTGEPPWHLVPESDNGEPVKNSSAVAIASRLVALCNEGPFYVADLEKALNYLLGQSTTEPSAQVIASAADGLVLLGNANRFHQAWIHAAGLLGATLSLADAAPSLDYLSEAVEALVALDEPVENLLEVATEVLDKRVAARERAFAEAPVLDHAAELALAANPLLGAHFYRRVFKNRMDIAAFGANPGETLCELMKLSRDLAANETPEAKAVAAEMVKEVVVELERSASWAGVAPIGEPTPPRPPNDDLPRFSVRYMAPEHVEILGRDERVTGPLAVALLQLAIDRYEDREPSFDTTPLQELAQARIADHRRNRSR